MRRYFSATGEQPHAAGADRTADDADGEVVVAVLDPAALTHYRFAAGATDFLLCARCGVDVGATVESGGWIVLNGRVMECAAELLLRPAEPKIFDNDSRDERLSRRRQLGSRGRVDIKSPPSDRQSAQGRY